MNCMHRFRCDKWPWLSIRAGKSHKVRRTLTFETWFNLVSTFGARTQNDRLSASEMSACRHETLSRWGTWTETLARLKRQEAWHLDRNFTPSLSCQFPQAVHLQKLSGSSLTNLCNSFNAFIPNRWNTDCCWFSECLETGSDFFYTNLWPPLR